MREVRPPIQGASSPVLPHPDPTGHARNLLATADRRGLVWWIPNDERRRVTHMNVFVPLPTGRVLPHA